MQRCHFPSCIRTDHVPVGAASHIAVSSLCCSLHVKVSLHQGNSRISQHEVEVFILFLTPLQSRVSEFFVISKREEDESY